MKATCCAASLVALCCSSLFFWLCLFLMKGLLFCWKTKTKHQDFFSMKWRILSSALLRLLLAVMMNTWDSKGRRPMSVNVAVFWNKYPLARMSCVRVQGQKSLLQWDNKNISERLVCVGRFTVLLSLIFRLDMSTVAVGWLSLEIPSECRHCGRLIQSQSVLSIRRAPGTKQTAWLWKIDWAKYIQTKSQILSR